MNHFTHEQKVQIRRMRQKGIPVAEVARAIGCSLQTVTYHARWERPPDQSAWSPKGRLALLKREEISIALARGETYTQIAARLGCAVSTVSREVAENGGRWRYRASAAHALAYRRARRPKRRKLANPRLKKVVTTQLECWWSPEQIARRLRIEFPNDPMMWVSHETIYQSIYVQGRGELRREAGPLSSFRPF